MPKLVTKAYENWPEVAGQFCIGERNDSGEKLLQFSTINNLAIMNTMYKHNHSTLTSLHRRVRNQIGYIIVCSRNINLM